MFTINLHTQTGRLLSTQTADILPTARQIADRLLSGQATVKRLATDAGLPERPYVEIKKGPRVVSTVKARVTYS